jgi:hypothetical protein
MPDTITRRGLGAVLGTAALGLSTAPAEAAVAGLQFFAIGYGPMFSDNLRFVSVTNGTGTFSRYDRSLKKWWTFPRVPDGGLLSRNHGALFWTTSNGGFWRAVAGGRAYQVRAADALHLTARGTDATGNLVAVDVADGSTALTYAAVYDVSARRTSLLRAGTDRANGHTSIDASGRYVAWSSSQIVGGYTRLWVRDRSTGSTTLVSAGRTGAASVGYHHQPQITANGRYVVFVSSATDLVSGATTAVPRIYARHLATRTTRVLMTAPEGVGSQFSVCSDLSRLAYVRNGQAWLLDRRNGSTTQLSRSATGASANRGVSDVSLAATGTMVGFTSWATNLGTGPTTELPKSFLRGVS